MNPQTAPIIEKWYKVLGFDSQYDAQFFDALHTISISPDTDAYNYDYDCTDGKKNLLAFLYMCEATQQQYRKKGIPDKILLDTLSDIVYWCKVWSDIKGELYLGEIGWLANYVRFQIFRLGRLQFCIEPVTENTAQFGMSLGESYLAVHIPFGGPMTVDACRESFAMAREFFAKYFPEVQYSWFSCNSWLLDESLREILPPESNILQFAAMFRTVEKQPADDIIRFVFGWDATRENMDRWNCRSDFAKQVKARIAQGQIFYETRGLIPK